MSVGWWVVVGVVAANVLLGVGAAIGIALATRRDPPAGQGEIVFIIGPVKEQR